MARAFFKLLALVPLALLFSSAAIAQVNNRREPASVLHGGGSEFFRALLHLEGIKPVTTEELQHPIKFDDLIVVVLGNPDLLSNRLRQTPIQFARGAVGNGGAVLIASKSNYHLDIDGVSIQNNDANVICRESSATFLGKHRDCPFAVPAGPGFVANDAARQLFDGDGMELKRLTRVVAGTPSYLTLRKIAGQSFVLPLAVFPDETYANPGLKLVKEKYFFSVGAEWLNDQNNKTSRLVALASTEPFNNELMRLAAPENDKDPTDNLELCFRTIEYLQGPNRSRKKCVFFQDGYLIEHFDDLARATASQKIPLPRTNMVNLQKNLIDKGNAIIDNVQQKDVLNSAINKLSPSAWHWVVLTVLWLAAIYASLFIVRRVFGSRKPTDLPPPPIIPSATSGPPGVFERREKELLRRDNVYEPVRDLIRDFFVSVGVQIDPGPRLPKLNISRAIRKPDSLRLALRDLWRLAYGPPSVVSVSQWRDLEPYFERVQQAHVDRKWAFAFEAVV